jgi:hypothetical protein
MTLKLLGTTITCENCNYDENKSSINSGNASYISVQNFFFDVFFVCTNLKIKVHETITMSVVLHVREMWFISQTQGV